MSFQFIFLLWLCFSLSGIVILYIGFGFVMNAKLAMEESRSQKIVVDVDTTLASFFLLLDLLLNIFTFSILMLDFRWDRTLTMVTNRLSQYNNDPDERAFRKWTADLFAAFLDGKDGPKFDHITGPNYKFPWLH
jgi:hypothetical protein